MKIALIGYGKMGKAVEEIACKRGHEIVLKIGSSDSRLLSDNSLSQADIAIEFTKPSSAFDNIVSCLTSRIPVVTGTTGWYDNIDDIKQTCYERNGSLLYASNFSIGVNIMFELNGRLATIMNSQIDYEVVIDEIHHVHKLDQPSGTAITLADEIIRNIDRKHNWSLANGTVKGSDVVINSKREGEVIGYHAVRYENEIDTFEIRHNAKNRKGFATGAVMAAEWLKGKKGIFTMRDMIQSLVTDTKTQ